MRVIKKASDKTNLVRLTDKLPLSEDSKRALEPIMSHANIVNAILELSNAIAQNPAVRTTIINLTKNNQFAEQDENIPNIQDRKATKITSKSKINKKSSFEEENDRNLDDKGPDWVQKEIEDDRNSELDNDEANIYLNSVTPVAHIPYEDAISILKIADYNSYGESEGDEGSMRIYDMTPYEFIKAAEIANIDISRFQDMITLNKKLNPKLMVTIGLSD